MRQRVRSLRRLMPFSLGGFLDTNDANQAPISTMPERKPKRKTIVGDKVKTLTLRTSEAERLILESKAEASFRSLNAQSVHLIKLFLRNSSALRQFEQMKQFNRLDKETPRLSTLPLRIPVDIHSKLKDQAARSGCTLNCLIRYALFAKAGLET